MLYLITWVAAARVSDQVKASGNPGSRFVGGWVAGWVCVCDGVKEMCVVCGDGGGSGGGHVGCCCVGVVCGSHPRKNVRS